MKNGTLYILLLLLTLTIQNSFAQNSIFAGKITDENNRPIAGARIKVSQTGNAIDEIMSDGKGLYYSQLLPQGNYNIDVRANGKYLKARKVYLDCRDDIKWFYNLKMAENELEVTITRRDPFIAATIEDIETNQRNEDFGVGKAFYQPKPANVRGK